MTCNKECVASLYMIYKDELVVDDDDDNDVYRFIIDISTVTNLILVYECKCTIQGLKFSNIADELLTKKESFNRCKLNINVRNNTNKINDPNDISFNVRSLYHVISGRIIRRNASDPKLDCCEKINSNIKIRYNCDCDRNGGDNDDDNDVVLFGELVDEL